MNKKSVKATKKLTCPDCNMCYSSKTYNHNCTICGNDTNCDRKPNTSAFFNTCAGDCRLEWEMIDKENKERDLAIIKYNVSQLSILDRVIYEAKRMYSKLFKS